ncbi:MAG: TolC family protein [Kofleriaceae bacterium]
MSETARLVAIVLAWSIPSVAHAERRELSLADAITIALKHNQDIYIAKTDTAIAATDIELAGSVFAPHLVGELRLWANQQPGSSTNIESSETAVSGNLELNGKIATGLTYALSLGTISERIDGFGIAYRPATTSALTLTVTQPLLRGGGRANRAPIVVATRRREASEAQLRVRLEQITGDVIVAYWTLVLAYKEVEARQSSFKLAQDQLADSMRLSKLGTISDLDVVEARAGVGKQQQLLVRSQQAIVDAESKLRNIIFGAGALADTDVIVPKDDPEIAPQPAELDPHLELARKNRPDVVAARAALRAEQAGLVETKNGLLPQLDVFATGGLIGFAGEPDDGLVGVTFDPKYTGGVGKSFSNIASTGQYTVSVGLRLDLPLDNSAARARHDRQRHLLARAKLSEDKVLAEISNQVRTSIRLLKSDEALKKIADEVVADNDKLLKGMRKRFAGGTITSFEVLRVADELSRAQIEAARARASYRVSLARLATSDGTLLQSLNISIASLRK